MASDEDIRLLARNPRESLAVELKAWIRPDVPKELAKITKALLALRNNNGGYLLIGVDDKTGEHLARPDGWDLGDLFHPDHVQELASKYASEPFEVETHHLELDSTECIAVKVPAGFKAPVVAKRDFKDPNSGSTLISEGAIFVRTLNANNRVSTSLIGVKDWPALIERCFDNREADIGRFLRRHLGAENAKRFADGSSSRSPAEEFLATRSTGFLDRAKTSNGGNALLGAMEIAVVLHEPLPAKPPSSDLLAKLMTANPELSGWPAWVDSREFGGDERPKVFEGGWEAFVAAQLFGSRAIDDWRIEPIGRLYLGCAIRDDMWLDRGPPPGTVVDFSFQIAWLTEALKVAASFLEALGALPDAALSVAVRWSGLKGRELSAWMSPGRRIWPGKIAHQDELTVSEAMSLDDLSATRTVVERLASQLFVLFDGHTFTSQVYDGLVAERLNRRG